jgi:flagellar hook assembly protein FlgD
VAIYDLKGRQVRSLDAGGADPQDLHLTWDGRDSTGAPVASGIYYVRAVGRDVDLTKKVMLVR